MDHSTPWRDTAADQELAESLGVFAVSRAICDGQRGYLVTNALGVRCFHYRLGIAFRQMLCGLGHGEDRDIMVVGEPEEGNCW